MTRRGGFAGQRRDGDHVIKTLGAGHTASAAITAAARAAGRAGLEGYLSALRAVGITLPPDLVVMPAGPLAVRHRWVAGPALLSCAAADPHRFAAAVAEIAGWAAALAPADARLDANLANFCLDAGQVVLVDVLPPLIPSTRGAPADLWEELFAALCFDTLETHNALISYAARALLRSPAPGREPVRLPAAAEPSGRGFPAVWFRARAVGGLRALAGDIPAAAAMSLFALTSASAFAGLPEADRAARVRRAGQVIAGLGLS